MTNTLAIRNPRVARMKRTLNVKYKPIVTKPHLPKLALKSKDISKKVDLRFQNPPNIKLFGCPICKDRFYEKAQALGGHMSKSHPHQSKEYTKKQNTRKEREPVRELLKLAKAIYCKAYPAEGFF